MPFFGSARAGGGRMTWWVSFSELFRNFGLIVAGAIGIYIAWRRAVASTQQADAALRQAELARRDHVAELFNRAVGQLSHEKLEIRLGAIYTLRQIARDSRTWQNRPSSYYLPI